MAIQTIAQSMLGCILFCWLTATAEAIVLSDDFTGGLNLPWVFLDDIGHSPPDFTSVTFNDADQDLKFIGSATDYEENFDLTRNATGYVGL